MRTQKILSAVLAFAIMLSCIGWTPTRAEEATLDNGAETVTENIQSQTSAEGIDILQPEAAQAHVARLRGEEQDNLNQQIFLNQDGSKTMYIYDHPVKYRDEQGEIHDISLDIADTGDAAYPYRTRANSAVTAFPAELSAGITLSGNGVSLRLAAQMPAGSTAGTTELVNHRVQRVDEQKVAYRYDADTTIEYALTYTGFKEDIVVNRYTGQTEYNFILYTNGLTLTQIGGGHYLTDESGEIQASIGQIIVFTADERNNTFGQLAATTIKENQIYGMTIVLDADYLADPNTKYPIRIDPTVSLTYADSGPDAIEDVVIQSKNEPLPQYGASVIGLPNKGISRLLVRFPGIDFTALEGVTVTSAALSIRDLMCEVEVMNVTCYPYTGTPWTETTAHWNTLNQSWGTALSSHDISYYDGLEQPQQFWYQFDITALAQQWVDGTADEDLGIILKASDAVEQDDEYLYKTFSSYERDSYKTKFTLTYNESISLDQEEVDLYVGESLTLLATTAPLGLNVTWSSENNAIATVEYGTVTGISPGTTTIVAELEDGTAVECDVTVVATRIWLDYNSIELGVGETWLLTATTEPLGLPVIWHTGNDEVATVEGDGFVRAKGPGFTYITASLPDATTVGCAVTVVESGISLNYTKLDVDEGTVCTTLRATTVPANRNVIWKSSNTSVASISQTGEITAKNAGVTTITASLSQGISATCTLYVTVKDGVYLIQNYQTQYYLGVEGAKINNLSNVQQQALSSATGKVESLCQLWKIRYIGYGIYTLYPMHQPEKALDVTANNVDIYTVSDEPYTEWRITRNYLGYSFENMDTDGYVMMPEDNSFEIGANVIVDEKTTNTIYRWILIEQTEVISGAILYDTATQESVIEPSRHLEVGEAKSLATLNLDVVAYSSTTFYHTFYWYSNNTNVAIVDSKTGAVSGVSVGSAIIYGRITIENRSFYVNFVVQVYDNYLEELTTAFDFTFDNALLIHSVYERIVSAFPNDSNAAKAWRTARVLGGITYDEKFYKELVWSDVAGVGYSGSEYHFFIDTLGFTESEYHQIINAIQSNHALANFEVADFSHMQITLSARLAYHLNITGYFSNIIADDETVSHLAGWLGDAVLLENNGMTSFGNDDYHADLDAENVYRQIVSGSTYLNAFNQYYESLSLSTRAEQFLSYINYETIKEKVYHELIDVDLYLHIEVAVQNGDLFTLKYYQNLLADEQYHMDKIKECFPDTYDFLCSIRDGLSDISDY